MVRTWLPAVESKFRLRLLVGAGVVLVSALVVSVVVHRIYLNGVLKVVSENARELLMVGDSRGATKIASVALEHGFFEIKVCGLGEQRLIRECIDLGTAQDSIVSHSLERHLYLDNTDKNPFVVFIGKFGLSVPLIGAFLFWLGTLVAAIPFVLSLREQMAKSYREDLERRTALGTAEVARQVVHDIRSPLSAIRMALESLSDFSDSKAIDALQVMRIATNRIVGMSDELSARASEHRPSISKEEMDRFDVVSVLESIVEEKSVELGREAVIKIHKDRKRPKALGDELGFRRVLSNLINNAIEATKSTEMKVDLYLRSKSGVVSVAVKDCGVGINPSDLAKLKSGEVFSTKGGFGIGVSSARMFAANLGGSLEIHSQLGVGTEVTMRLPSSNA